MSMEEKEEPERPAMPQTRLYEEPEARFVKITPEMAAEWLEFNRKNRTEKYGGTVSYSGDMADGEWMVTGDTIKFDWFGNLIDGQHRLKACIQAGRTIISLVVWGVDPKAQDRVDTGMSRSFRDQLQMAGVKYAPTISALARRVYLWEPPNNERISFQKGKISPVRLEKVLKTHEEIVHCAVFVHGLASKADLHASHIAFLYWVLRQANPDEAPVFIHKLALGVGLEENDPILVLRDWIRREKPKKSRDFEGELLWKTVLAWNAWLSGRKISKLQLPKGGKRASLFPRLRTKRRVPRTNGAEDVFDDN